LTDYSVKTLQVKNKALNDLFFFSKEILCYDLIREKPHRELCIFLNKPKKKKLILLPRGSFKSTIATIAYPLWMLMYDPNLRILISSETFGQSKTFLTAIKDHIERNEVFRAIFGDAKGGDAVWRQEEITIRGRTRVAREPSIGVSGVGQTRVGMHYDIIILDDVVSNNNINTPEQIQKTINHYKLLLSILEPNSTLIIIGTRYHFADLYGHILENEPDNFDMLIRAAIEGGKLYFPSRLTKKYLDEQKKSQGNQHFANQYLNNPVDQDSAMFKLKWIRYFREGPERVRKYILIDPASTDSKTSDFTGIIICGVDPDNNIFVYEAINNKSTIGEMISLIFEKVLEYKVYEDGCVALEVNANQQTYQYIFQEEMKKRKFFFPITELRPNSTRSKASRIKGLQPWFENGKIYLKEEQQELIDQITMYPRTRHDDLCFSGGTLIMTSLGLKPIRDIYPNDEVWTRQGLKRVSHKSCRVDVCEDYIVNGMEIRCTPNHNIITKNGKKQIKNLTSDDHVFIDKTWGLSKQLYLTEKRIEDILKAREDATGYISNACKGNGKIDQRISIEMFGNLITEKYLKAMSSIIEMRIRLIMTSQTLSLKKLKNICRNICRKEIRTSSEEKWIMQEYSHQSGTEAKTEKNSINGLGKKRGKIKPLLKSNACFVEKKSKPTLKERNSAMTKFAETNIEEGKKEKVYNLTVEGCHEYLAGGVLVANCDSLANILQVMVPATAPEPEDKWEGTKLTNNEVSVWKNCEKVKKRMVHRTKIRF
jgi:predicted phage terminase large subunit-like protein